MSVPRRGIHSAAESRRRLWLQGSGFALLTEMSYDQFNNVNWTTVTGDGISGAIVTQADFGPNGHLKQAELNAAGHLTTFYMECLISRSAQA